MVPFSYNVRSLMVRKVTTIATAAGIALVVFVFAAAQMLAEGVNRALATSGRDDVAIVLRKGSDAELSSAIGNDYLNILREHQGVMQGEGGGVIGELVAVITAPHANAPETISNVLIRGMPPEGMKFRPEARIVSGRAPAPGTNEVIVGKAISGRFVGVGPGQSFDVRRNRPLKVVGEFTADGSSYESEVWGDLDVIRSSFGRASIVSSARVRLTNPNQFNAYRDAIEGNKRFSMKVMREPDYYKKQSEMTGFFLKFLGNIMSVMLALAAMIGAAITMNGAVANRTKEIGTLRALGFSRLAVLVSFILEAIVLAVLGGAIGVVCVQLMALVSFPVMNFATFSEIVIAFRATPTILITALGFSVVMGLVGGLFPAIRAARVSPVEAMRA